MGTWVIMVGRFIVYFWLVVVVATIADATTADHVRVQCGYTRYPSLCLQTLSRLAGTAAENRHVDVLSALLNSTVSLTTLPVSNFESLSSRFVSSEAQLARHSIGYCHELTTMSNQRLSQAMAALKESPEKNKADIQTWISAAITFQQTCKDSADDHAASNDLMAQISRTMDYHSRLASNALALANRITKSSPETRNAERHLSEDTDERRFPSWVSAGDRKMLESSGGTIQADAVVAKDGSGNYKTVSEAINAAGGGRFVIYVKSGVYKEKIRTKKDGITLIGDGKYSTIITGDDSVGGGSSLPESATFAISGDGFIAKDIGFENTAGAGSHQAVALTVSSDHSVLFRCSIAGYQDSLYALSLRQFYRECDIYGTIDFIFGNAAAVFQSCQLVLRRPRSGGAYNVILANGRSDPGQNTGFSVQNCKITVGSDFSPVRNSFNSFLGRPWKQYSRSVVMQSNIDGEIASRGWVEWPGASGSVLKTLYFAEYANMGAGAGLGGRVGWAGFHAIGKDEAEKFTVANLISGTSWLPSTGVTFVSGL
ncbi:PREDICTED: pectinesterase-like [Ipomoea nil]|uniref:pectinesterase-like n=1 Tax=Ipomoea nil TaxID=35883 RepID=UPI0009018977|nr:PREDICTED: pectinesterase-like [Ipomoea nil]